ncbi:hypothetical protein P8631_19190, partial [Guyparkeria sp. 1SP6A2]|nr:hypothetical protein [Guyparkeria sp. 1SP6A2]
RRIISFHLSKKRVTLIIKNICRKIKKWQRNRFDAYQGSLMHFMRAVFRNRIAEEGFEVRKVFHEEKIPGTAFSSTRTYDYVSDYLLRG